MPDLQLFAMRLKQARLRNGLTQTQLGVMAQIDEGSASARVNQYERGKHWPDFGTAERLAAALDVPAAFFYTRDESLAALILCYGDMSAADREKLLTRARILAAPPERSTAPKRARGELTGRDST
jgi:transcriptional regulator with XRE-family HTH domain